MHEWISYKIKGLTTPNSFDSLVCYLEGLDVSNWNSVLVLNPTENKIIKCEGDLGIMPKVMFIIMGGLFLKWKILFVRG